MDAFLTFAYDVFKKSAEVQKEAYEIARSPSGTSPKVEEMLEIYGELSQLIHQNLQSVEYVDEEARKAAVKCKEACNELERRLSKLKATSTGDLKLVRTVLVAVRTVRYKEEIEELKNKVRDYQVQMMLLQSLGLSKGLNTSIAVLQMQTSEESKKFVSHFEKLKSDLGKVDGTVQALQVGNADSAALLGHLRDMVKQLAAVSEERRSAKEAQVVLKSLGYQEYAQHYATIQDAHQATFGWVYGDSLKEGASSQRILTWLEHQDGYFWITGKPGAGKSTLMKYLVDNPHTTRALSRWAGSSRIITAQHFFWSVGSVLQHSFDGLLRSLLLQIFAEAPMLVRSICEEEAWWKDSETSSLESRTTSLVWTVPMMTRCLERLARTATLTTDIKLCFFIDGLDEYDGSQKDPYEVAEWLKTLTAKPSRVKICFASQSLPAFLRCFDKDPRRILHVHDCTAADVESYARSKLTEHIKWLSADVHGSLVRNLVFQIRWRAEGVFLWVAIAVRELCTGLLNGDSITTLESLLNDIPSDLEAYIRKLLGRTQDRYQQRRTDIFRMALARWPLPLEEEIYAFHDRSYDFPDPRRRMTQREYLKFFEEQVIRIQAITGGLFQASQVEYDRGNAGKVVSSRGTRVTRVTFLHRTVREFVRKHLETPTPHETHTFDPKLAILKAQVLKVQLSPLEMLNPTMTQCGLFDLLIMDWGKIGSGIHAPDQNNSAQTTILLDTWERILLQVLPSYRENPDDSYHQATNLLFMRQFLKMGEAGLGQVNLEYFQGTERQSLLSNIFQACVLEHGPVNYIQVKMQEDETYLAQLPIPPLHTVILYFVVNPSYIHLDIIHLLLDHGHDPNELAWRNPVDGAPLSSLMIFADYRPKSGWLPHIDDEVRLVELLLEAGADPNAVLTTKACDGQARYYPVWVWIYTYCIMRPWYDFVEVRARVEETFSILIDVVEEMFAKGADISLFNGENREGHTLSIWTETTEDLQDDEWDGTVYRDEISMLEYARFTWHLLYILAEQEASSGKKVIPWDDFKPLLRRIQKSCPVPVDMERLLIDHIVRLEAEDIDVGFSSIRGSSMGGSSMVVEISPDDVDVGGLSLVEEFV